ncbi:hypothetical protein LEN26_013921 [Aphanomyces euteiches]|nr:hypothetical protein LEN26_013921 [Aphanomyces euteiches]
MGSGHSLPVILPTEWPWSRIAIVATVSTIALVTSRAILRFLWKSYQVRNIPGPKASSFLLGHALDTLGRSAKWHLHGDYPEPYISWIKQFGNAILFRELFNYAVIFADPKAIQHVLATNGRNYPRDKIIASYLADIVLGEGLLSTEGSVHDEYRKILNPIFTSNSIKSFVPIYDTQTRIICETIIQEAAKNGQTLNMTDVFTDLSLRTIGLAGFGFNFKDDAEAQKAYNNAQLVPTPLILVGTRVIPRFLDSPLPSLVRRREAQAQLKKVVNTVIEHKLAGSTKDGPKDLLDLILPHSSPEEAFVHTMTFLTAGHETTTSALGWIIVNLIKHPNVATQVRWEYKAVVAKFGSLNSWEAVDELIFTLAVIQESLRLNAIAAKVARRTCASDDIVPMQEGPPIFVPAGTTVEVVIAAMNRHPKYWAKPDSFIPERFLEGSPEWNADLALRDGKPHALYYIPFSAGSKNCIGQRFSIVEMQVVVATLIGQFDFKLAQDADTRTKYNGVTTFPTRLTVNVSIAE